MYLIVFLMVNIFLQRDFYTFDSQGFYNTPHERRRENMPANLIIYPVSDYELVITICLMLLSFNIFIYYVNPVVYHTLIPFIVIAVNILLMQYFQIIFGEGIEYEHDTSSEEDDVDTETSLVDEYDTVGEDDDEEEVEIGNIHAQEHFTPQYYIAEVDDNETEEEEDIFGEGDDEAEVEKDNFQVEEEYIAGEDFVTQVYEQVLRERNIRQYTF